MDILVFFQWRRKMKQNETEFPFTSHCPHAIRSEVIFEKYERQQTD